MYIYDNVALPLSQMTVLLLPVLCDILLSSPRELYFIIATFSGIRILCIYTCVFSSIILLPHLMKGEARECRVV